MRQIRNLGRKGVVAIEFAIMGTLLLLLLVGVVDLGIAFYEQMAVQTAAEAGAQYVTVNGFSVAGINNAVANSSVIATTTITASPAPSQFCGCPGSGGISAISCTSTCTGGIAPSKYVRIDTTATHWAVFTQGFLPSPFTLTGSATVRIP